MGGDRPRGDKEESVMPRTRPDLNQTDAMRDWASTVSRWALDVGANYSATAARTQLHLKRRRSVDLWESRFHARLAEQTANQPTPGVVVDVGAHLGVISSIYAERSLEVWAIEPNIDLVARLHHTLPSEVVIAAVACGATAGWAELRVPRHHGRPVGALGSLVSGDPAECGDSQRVPVVRMDDLVPNKVDVLKIDAEGFELEVLEGATRILGDQPVVVIESEERHRPGAPEAVRLLLESIGLTGYMVYRGQVVPAAMFDPAIHQRNPPGVVAGEDDDYVEQFVYVAAERGDQLAATLEESLS